MPLSAFAGISPSFSLPVATSSGDYGNSRDFRKFTFSIVNNYWIIMFLTFSFLNFPVESLSAGSAAPAFCDAGDGGFPAAARLFKA